MCVVVDCNAFNWGALVERHGKELYNKLITSIMGFCNAQLAISMHNQLLLLAAAPGVNDKILYSSLSKSNNMKNIIETALQRTLHDSANTDGDELTKFASTIAISICFIERCKREFQSSFGRILLLSLTNDLSAEQNLLMNLFFSAQQHKIVIDVASLGDSVPILQQACDITNGTHLSIEKPDRLLQYLVTNCIGNSQEVQEFFNRNEPKSIDYRAACHCHNKLVQIGWVCSVCLAIQCRISPICPMCNSIFPLPTQGFKKTKKRKKEK